ncbi:MAG: MBL fold metallo-hydrolase [Kiritimatiellae bacterium]|nr:MBL fold metallo-hydrolase [Kiritimatiellia bacterium]
MDAIIDEWQRDTDLVSPEIYREYLRDGDTRSLVSLQKLESGFERVIREIAETDIVDVPAVWSVYNMGYVVKTRESLFSIDLVHRRAVELADKLDFALITHNHGDHCSSELYSALNKAGKTVISNFLDNYGATGKGAKNPVGGGFVVGEKIFKIKDVEISTSLVDHNKYLLDFTTAFEIRVGNWKLYHSGDCGVADKLKTRWGRPDVWTFFPGCGINVADAVKKINPRKLVFGHMWELNHLSGRLNARLIKSAIEKAKSVNANVHLAFWGDRVDL